MDWGWSKMAKKGGFWRWFVVASKGKIYPKNVQIISTKFFNKALKKARENSNNLTWKMAPSFVNFWKL